MTVLDSTNRAAVSADFQRDLSVTRTSLALTKAQLQAAIDATDQWIDDNASAFNSALPTAARTTLTAQQKLDLFLRVARRRARGD